MQLKPYMLGFPPAATQDKARLKHLQGTYIGKFAVP